MTGNELQGVGTNGGTVRMFPVYRTAIGDAMFPGEDVHTMRLRGDFSEMLVHHLESGGELEVEGLRAALSAFTPLRVSTTAHRTWADRDTEEWVQLDRPRIHAVMDAFFNGGGLASRLEDFVRIAVMGRAHGIQIASDGLHRRGIGSALHRAGFAREQQREILSNIREPARRPAAWKRLLHLIRRR